MALQWFYTRAGAQYRTDIIVTIEHLDEQIIEFDTPYIMGIQMLDVYVNGIYQPRDKYEEESVNSIRFVEEDYLKEGDIVSIRFNPSNVNLGDIRVVPTYAKLLQLDNPVRNEVALVTSQRKFFIYEDGMWVEFIIPFTTQNVGIMFAQETQEVTDHTHRTITLNELSYSPGMGNLLVFINGKKVDPNEYVEVDNKTILFNQNLPEDAETIEFLVANTDTWEDSNNHKVTYTYYENGNIHEEIVTVGMDVIKYTEFMYDENDNIVQEVVTKGTKTIIKNYSYDSSGNIEEVTVAIV